jgi:hypothetical protein
MEIGGATLLADHNIEGQSMLLLGILATQGWLELAPIRIVSFSSVGLPPNSSDRAVSRFVQERQMILLTGNRNMREQDSLERTIQEENTPISLPVLTIGSPKRLDERPYREKCADRLVEIVVDIELYRGAGRLYIP